jgi:hypothetical protein
MFPLFINTEDGKAIPWRRAMNPPGGSDAQIRAAWDRLTNRVQPQSPGGGGGGRMMSPMECVVAIQAGYAACN